MIIIGLPIIAEAVAGESTITGAGTGSGETGFGGVIIFGGAVFFEGCVFLLHPASTITINPSKTDNFLITLILEDYYRILCQNRET